MTLTPEQKAEGWIEWNGGKEGPIKDDRTIFEWGPTPDDPIARITRVMFDWNGAHKRFAYRIIEAHGADAEPARPTPYPNGYDDLVFTDDGWSQPIITDGKRPEWLRDDDLCIGHTEPGYTGWPAHQWGGEELAIRVRRREPKRETQRACLRYQTDRPFDTDLYVTIDLIDGKPDLSTIKIAEGVL